jgi:hypothetical protein
LENEVGLSAPFLVYIYIYQLSALETNGSYVHQLRDSEDKLGPVVMQVSWTFEATILQFFF